MGDNLVPIGLSRGLQGIFLSGEAIRGLYAEAKSAGFDATAPRQIIRMRKQEPAERDARQVLVDEYMRALGDYGSTPLGQAAIARAGAELMPPV